MQQELLLVGIKPDELLSKIEAIIDSRLSKISGFQDKDDPSTKYLSRAEVAQLLKISLPTIYAYSKIGLLKPYKIGKRVLFKQEEIQKALQQTSIQKYKKSKQW